MELTPGERRQLAATFGCSDADLDATIGRYAEAATEEYVRMILGQRVFTRGQDAREYRLYLMITHVFAGRLPSEQQICALFQTTATQSRGLLRAVMSKYQYELQEAISGTLRDVLNQARENPNVDGGRLLTIDSGNVIEALNRRIAALDGTLPQISRSPGTVSTYEVAPSSFARLQRDLG